MVRRHEVQLSISQLVLYTPSGGVMHPGGKVPAAKTVVRLGQLLDGEVLRSLFDRVVQMAVEKKVTAGRRIRIDTTVVEANIHYPDSGLCEDNA